MEYLELNNGVKCPAVGLGTYMLSPADAENSVREALKMGYSLVDTANAYVNERAVGRGIRESGVAREDIFLSTKLWPSEYGNDNAVDETLKATGDEPAPLHAGPFRRFSPRCRRLASARLPPPRRKSLENCSAWSAKQFLASGFVSGQGKARREYFVYCQGL